MSQLESCNGELRPRFRVRWHWSTSVRKEKVLTISKFIFNALHLMNNVNTLYRLHRISVWTDSSNSAKFGFCLGRGFFTWSKSSSRKRISLDSRSREYLLSQNLANVVHVEAIRNAIHGVKFEVQKLRRVNGCIVDVAPNSPTLLRNILPTII